MLVRCVTPDKEAAIVNQCDDHQLDTPIASQQILIVWQCTCNTSRTTHPTASGCYLNISMG